MLFANAKLSKFPLKCSRRDKYLTKINTPSDWSFGIIGRVTMRQ